jgi:hypothetical protein
VVAFAEGVIARAAIRGAARKTQPEITFFMEDLPIPFPWNAGAAAEQGGAAPIVEDFPAIRSVVPA